MPGSRDATRTVRAGLIVGGLIVGAFVEALSGQAAAHGCTIFWSGAASTSWSDAANWSLTDGGPASATVPGATDVACLAASPARVVVVLRRAAAVRAVRWSVAGPAADQPLLQMVDGAALTLGGPERSVVAQLRAGVARLDGPGAVDVTVSLDATGATFAPAELTMAGGAGSQFEAVTLDGTDVSNGGVLQVRGDLDFAHGATITNSGRLTQVDGGRGTVDTWRGDGSVTTLANPSTPSVGARQGPGRTWRIAVSFLNRGLMTTYGGPVELTRSRNYHDGTLSGGSWRALTALDLGGPITTIAAGTSVADEGGLVAELSTLTTVAGALRHDSSGRFAGVVTVVAGGELEGACVAPGLVVAGRATLAGAVDEVRVRPGGALTLPGDLTGSVDNRGTVITGGYRGVGRIHGSYTAAVGSRTRSSGLYVSGDAVVAGTATLSPGDVFGPHEPDVLLLAAASVTGRYDRVDVGPGRRFTVRYTDDAVWVGHV